MFCGSGTGNKRLRADYKLALESGGKDFGESVWAGFESVLLINDLKANARAIPLLWPSDLQTIIAEVPRRMVHWPVIALSILPSESATCSEGFGDGRCIPDRRRSHPHAASVKAALFHAVVCSEGATCRTRMEYPAAYGSQSSRDAALILFKSISNA